MRLSLPKQDQICLPPFSTLAKLGIAATLVVSLAPVATAQMSESLEFAVQPTTTPATSNLLFVNSTVGNDAGEGSQRSPFRTITRALQFAQPGTVILLSPGTYSADSGESFPLRLPPGVTLQGDPANHGRGILVRGGGDYLSPTAARQNVTVLAADQSVLTGVTVTNTNARGYGLWIESTSPTVMNNTFTGSQHDGVSVNGASAPLIQGNHFSNNGASGISVFGNAQPQIRNNRFENTGFGVNVADQAAPLLVGNAILNNRNGVVVQEQARPTLRNNRIEGNRQNGLVAIAQSLPDLGTASDPGNNQFANNGELDVNATAADGAFPAAGNNLSSDRTSGSVDLAGTTPLPAPVASILPASPAPATVTMPPTISPAQPTTVATITPPTSSRPAETVNFGQLPPTLASSSVSQAETAFPSPTQTGFLANQDDDPPRLNLVQASPPSVPSSNPSVNAESITIPVPDPVSTREQVPLTNPGTASAVPATPTSAPASPREIVVRRSPAASAEASPTPTTLAIAPADPVEIPVIPATTPAPPPTPQTPNPAPVRNENLLPVPGPDIPIGNIGDMPTVTVSSTPWLSGISSNTPRPSAQALGLRYRVLVDASGDRTQEQVRTLVPGAFRTWFEGRSVMQAGAFGDRANAEEAAQMLNGYGLRAIVAPIE